MGKIDQGLSMGADEPGLAVTRRGFLKGSGGTALALTLTQLGGAVSSAFVRDVFAAEKTLDYRGVPDLYRQIWNWDKVTWGSHTNVCLPGSCSFHVYVKDGMVWREEQSAKNHASNPNYPDYNPLGCQKGCSFHSNLYGDERIKYPLRRIGERGSGKWERISWDEAVGDIASAIVDGLEEFGPDSFVLDPPHAHLGSVGWAGSHRMNAAIGGVNPDLNVLIGDFYKGISDTIGKMHIGYSADNLFDAELVFTTCTNWSYTMPAVYHFLTEARYNGTELVSIAPDYSPSTIHADYHVPVKTGTDAGFWMAICEVLVSENLIDRPFIKEQTDLPLLVRTDSSKFLRETDVTGAGREDQLYVYDSKAGAIAKAPRGTLKFSGDPALEGRFEVKLHDGTTVTVIPVFESLKKVLAEHTPEKAQAMTGVHPSLVRTLAKKVATKRTAAYIGFSSAKIYHGDLAERSLMLAMALTGNWGKPGTGWNSWAMPADHVEMMMLLEKPVHLGGLAQIKELEDALAAKARAADPEISQELIGVELVKQMTAIVGTVPPVFFLYHHAGYKELYDNAAWHDPALKKSFTGYMDEAIEKGWWNKTHLRPAPDKQPRVLMITASNPIRRVRSAALQYPKHLFPKLKMMFAVEPRMSSTAMFCDIVLPAAWYYEKPDMTISITTNPRMCMIEQAVQPPGECKPEWDIYSAILQKVVAIAAERGLTGYQDVFGQERRYADLWNRYSMNGYLKTQEDALKEMVAIAEATGTFPKGTTYESFRKAGMIEQASFGMGFMKDVVANEYDPRKPFFSLRWHVDEKKTYPTYTRRAQFYLDHDWYLEANEALPRWKAQPKIGGDHPFAITGGHPRHSVHSVHLAQPSLMRLHRAQPVMHVNDKIAKQRGVADGEMVEVFNDFSNFEIMLRTTPTVAPDQVVVYFWEAYQFPEWKVYDRLLIGQPKPLHLAGGYEQLRYYLYNGSPGPSTDRGVRVDFRKIKKA
ncbi:MAG: molybdopterin-dependent oxidoreductase [Immundisolibacter sp.]|uniref:molybdopterin-dependent oxidoreductase n=1 Tax=Immundisolibacter sp. TaxID=1934948 RepID=UPI003D0A0F58